MIFNSLNIFQLLSASGLQPLPLKSTFLLTDGKKMVRFKTEQAALPSTHRLTATELGRVQLHGSGAKSAGSKY